MSIRVMADVWQHSTQGGSTLLVLLKLADHADDERMAWPAIDSLARAARVDRRTVQRALRRLEEGGEILLVPPAAHWRTNRYWIGCKGGEMSPPRHPAAPGAALAPPKPSLEPLSPTDSVEQRSTAGNHTEEIHTLFSYWREHCGHPRARLTADRRTKIRARLKDGYSVEDVKRAIDGAAHAPYVNEHGVRFDDLDLICRNGAKLEQFMSRAPRDTWDEYYARRESAQRRAQEARNAT